MIEIKENMSFSIVTGFRASVGQSPIDDDAILGKMYIMMTSSNGNIFLVTGPLCGEYTGH